MGISRRTHAKLKANFKFKAFIMSENRLLRIGELAELTGITASAIRYYEKEGVLHSSQRTEGGSRRFDHSAVLRLHMVRSLQNLGFSLADIPAMLRDADSNVDHERVMSQLDQRLNEVSGLIHNLQQQHDRLAQLKAVLSHNWSQGRCLSDEELVALSMQSLNSGGR